MIPDIPLFTFWLHLFEIMSEPQETAPTDLRAMYEAMSDNAELGIDSTGEPV